jgi:beta-N-acetylhexosaminidase
MQGITSSVEDAKKALGQMFIVGFSGLELSNDTAAFLSQANIGGVILFAHNYETPAGVAELINQVQECRTESPLWISVDQEGGKVQRFKKGFTIIPPAATVGAIDSPKLAFELAEMMARELKAVGVNLNFCPVADIQTNPNNPVIGSRAYGTTEDQVSKIVTGIVRGHLIAGVQPCVKHFPGHGDSSVDTHFALAKVDTPLEVLREREFRPFMKAVKSRCAMIMTSHVVVTSIDRDFPATLSKKILTDVLRGELRYSRIIVTDDMEMKAVTDHFGAEDAPRLAIEAGCDLLIYRSEAGARHAYASVLKALEDGKLSPKLVLESVARLREHKKEHLNPYQAVVVPEAGKKVGLPEHQALVEKVLEASNSK